MNDIFCRRVAQPYILAIVCYVACISTATHLGAGEPVQPIPFQRAGIVKAWETYKHQLTFGKGQTLALVDDGCDLSMPEWSQASGDQPKVLVAYDNVDNDDQPQHEGRGYHGSTIGIPSSLNFQGKWGVAYQNQIAVLRGLECCHCQLRDAQTLAKSLQWIIDNGDRYRVTTVNLAPVDDEAHAHPISTSIDAKLHRLRQLGIWVSSPTGNHDFVSGISWPACQPNCFAIGAVKPNADIIHLDRSPKVDLVVPASATSSANAIACGAAMVVREALVETGYDWRPHGSNMPEAILAIMQETGVSIKDGETNLEFQRLDLSSALAHIYAGAKQPRSTRFSEHLIADRYAYAYGIAAADFDRDGDLDLTSADYTPHDRLYLFENDQHGIFQRYLIQDHDPERLERHSVGDIDGDGDLDIVIVKNLRGHLIWFENQLDESKHQLWPRRIITTKLPGAYDVTLADFDLDGDLDVAASSWVLGNQFAWFENKVSSSSGEWQKHLIEHGIAETRTARVADFDNDGDLDFLGTARQAGQVIWYQNQLSAQGISWKKHLIDDRSPCPAHGNPADIDGDGDIDVVMALGFYYRPGSQNPAASQQQAHNQIVWYENSSEPNGGTWEKHVIGAEFDDAFEAVAGDLDGDGDLDVATTSWRNPGRVAWFENHGDPRGQWTRHLLKNNWRSANQIIIADLNGDGRMDIVACAERGSNELRWWRNEGPVQ